MKLVDILIFALVLLVVGLAVIYIRKAGKKGVKCIGCPSGGNCTGSCSGCGGNCGGQQN